MSEPAPGACPPLTVVTERLPSAAQGWDYEATIEVDGGQPPLHFQELGELPPGIGLDYGTGVLADSPTAPGPFAFEIVVYDACEPDVQSVTRSYEIVVE